jgi:hypothetical protein
MIGEDSAEGRARRTRDHPHARDEALKFPAFARRDDLGYHRLCDDEEPAAPEPLQSTEKDELVERLRGTAERRGDDENDDRDDHRPSSAVDIAELPVYRRERRRRDEIRDDDPSQMIERVEIGRDRC